jgi:glycosyltransferase involved in cell wall biosynthesis
LIKLKKILLEEKWDYIHIVWEWPIWWVWIYLCNRFWLNYTTSFHSKFPEYFYLRTKFPISIWYKILKSFHENAKNLLISTESLKLELEKKWFKNLKVCPLWVDNKKFKRIKNVDLWFKKPIFIYMWRIAIEKNIEDFLKLKLLWTKLVVWDWPQRKKLENKYKNVKFVWYKEWQELVRYLSWSDVFVFPSKTDTFWLSVLEAMACWLPVIAYNVTGPKDIITNWYDWYVWDTLEENILKWLKIPRKNPINTATKYSWENMTDKFLEYQVPTSEL